MVKETAGQELLLSTIIYSEPCIIFVQPWVAGEGPTIEWSHLPRKIVRDILPRSWRLYLIVLKVVACLAS